MKSKKKYGETEQAPVHNEKNRNHRKTHTNHSTPFFRPKKRKEKKEVLTVEQEILRMREEERKKAEQKAKKPQPEKKKTAKNQKEPMTERGTREEEKRETASFHGKRKGGAVRKGQKRSPVRIIPLGGLGEIGKNMTVIETDEDIIVIDCGMGFPDDGMLGVDLVIPDTEYLKDKIHKIRGIFLTHGHEDHIGAIPYVLKNINVPLYGTKLTLGIVENKLIEAGIQKSVQSIVVHPGETVRAGAFSVEFIRVNHSIADAVAFAVHSPVGTLVFTGDFKIDSTPIAGEMTDLTRLGELGKEGVTALFCDSTNCERPGFAPSERVVGTSLGQIFRDRSEERRVGKEC